MAKRSKVGFLDDGAAGFSARDSRRESGDDKSSFFDHPHYHLVHNFGSERRIIFGTQEDFDRFEGYLYVLNAIDSPRASNIFASPSSESVFKVARGETLVAIGAYSLTPKDFFILLRPLVHDGVGRFMQKLQTAYTMYFNKKYTRSGRLFHAAYRSEDAFSHEHLRSILAFVHLHPASLFDEGWQEADLSELQSLAKNALAYRYSSASEYAKKKFVITSPEHFPKFFLKMQNADAHMRSWGKFQIKDKISRLMDGGS